LSSLLGNFHVLDRGEGVWYKERGKKEGHIIPV